MKYSILLVTLLSVTALFSAENLQTASTSELQKSRAELQAAKDEAYQAKEELAIAKRDIQQSKEDVEEAKKCLEESKLKEEKEKNLKKNQTLVISVTGQGVAPMNTSSPAQAYALAKRAAIADAYRAIAEKVQGVRIDGQELIKDMMVKRSVIRTSVKAMVRNANVVETTFKEGLCEVEMEIVISYSDFIL